MLSQTLKVEENKVVLFFKFEQYFESYSLFVILAISYYWFYKVEKRGLGQTEGIIVGS